MMLPLCSLILSPDLACMWSLLWKACTALGWVATSRSWHLRLLNKIAKWLLYNRGHRCIRAGHGDGGNIYSCCGKCRRIRTKRKKKGTECSNADCINEHRCHPGGLLLRTWHVARAQEAPKGAWSATDGILYAACGKFCSQLRPASFQHETNPACKYYVNPSCGFFVPFLEKKKIITTESNFHFRFHASSSPHEIISFRQRFSSRADINQS